MFDVHSSPEINNLTFISRLEVTEFPCGLLGFRRQSTEKCKACCLLRTLYYSGPNV